MPTPVFFRWVIGLAIVALVLNLGADTFVMQDRRDPAVGLYAALLWLIAIIWERERNPDVRKPPGPIMRATLVVALLTMMVYGGVRLVGYMDDTADRELNERIAAGVLVTFFVALMAYWLGGREPPADDQAKSSKPKT